MDIKYYICLWTAIKLFVDATLVLIWGGKFLH